MPSDDFDALAGRLAGEDRERVLSLWCDSRDGAPRVDLKRVRSYRRVDGSRGAIYSYKARQKEPLAPRALWRVLMLIAWAVLFSVVGPTLDAGADLVGALLLAASAGLIALCHWMEVSR